MPSSWLSVFGARGCFTLGVCLSAFISACISTQLQSTGPYRLVNSSVGSVAVAPFTNLTQTKNAGQAITDALLTALYDRPPVRVLDAIKTARITYSGPVERSRAQEPTALRDLPARLLLLRVLALAFRR